MIEILASDVINRIAAGEVVERPASVVRELLDNAIDAGAQRIDVEIENGGTGLIRISDDGCGMSPGDAKLSVERHATSKIKRFEDLAEVMTKGFRGEALAAISSISRFELKTRRREDEFGTLIAPQNGGPVEAQKTGAAAGTVISVRDLFFNTPARRKFLKKPATELSHIMTTVTNLALAHEGIHFTVTNNGRRTLDCPSVRNRPERIRQIFGQDVLEQLIPVDMQTPLISISGLISRPTLTRNGAHHIHFFVNDRIVKDKLLHRALVNGYRNLIPAGRYPVTFLYIDIDPSEIDVNVHPAKQEIKFAHEDAVFSAMYGAVRQAWDARDEVKEEIQKELSLFAHQKSAPPPKRDTQGPVDGVEEAKRMLTLPAQEPQPEKTPEPPTPQAGPPAVITEPAAAPPEKPAAKMITDYIPVFDDPKPKEPSATVESLNRKPLEKSDSPSEPEPDTKSTRLPLHPQDMFDVQTDSPKTENLFAPKSLEETGVLRVIGQLLDSYILAESDEGFFIIDQHAAHERIMFERFFTRAENAPLESQSLLFPLTVDFSPEEAVLIEENLDLLTRLGFEVEPFGPRTFVIRAVPNAVSLNDAETFIQDVVGELKKEGSAKEKRDRALHTMACRASVKFGDTLSRDDMQALIDELAKMPRRNVCPHGRPNILYVSDDGLRRAFKRTGF